MAEIALLPRRLAEWSGAPPRWYPLQLGGCQHDANRRAPGDGNHKISRLPQATEYQEEPQEENDGFVYRSMLSVPRVLDGTQVNHPRS